MKPPTRFHSFPTKDRHLFVQFWVDMQSSQNEGFSSGFWSPKMGQTIIRMSSWWVVGILAGSWVDPKDHNLLPSNEDLCGIEAARAAGLCAQRLAQQQGATAAKCAEDAGDFKGGVGWVGWIGWVSGRGGEEKILFVLVFVYCGHKRHKFDNFQIYQNCSAFWYLFSGEKAFNFTHLEDSWM